MIVIFEAPDTVAAAALATTLGSSGAFTSVKTTALLTPPEAVRAMVGSVTWAMVSSNTTELSPEDVYGLHCAWELIQNEDPAAPAEADVLAGRHFGPACRTSSASSSGGRSIMATLCSESCMRNVVQSMPAGAPALICVTHLFGEGAARTSRFRMVSSTAVRIPHSPPTCPP